MTAELYRSASGRLWRLDIDGPDDQRYQDLRDTLLGSGFVLEAIMHTDDDDELIEPTG